MAYQTFDLCHECACEVINGDDSARDYYGLTDDERASRDAAIEAMGNVSMIGRQPGGCFACFVCDETMYSDSYVFERV